MARPESSNLVEESPSAELEAPGPSHAALGRDASRDRRRSPDGTSVLAEREKISEAQLRAISGRTGMDTASIQQAFLEHLFYTVGKDHHNAQRRDAFVALAHVVRDRLMQRWMRTQQRYYEVDAKRVYYLSLEFLMGRALANNLISMGLYDEVRAILAEFDIDLTDLCEQERDAGLGNGGLGRLAACYLDAMATLALPGYGYGIRYEFGIFDQVIRNGAQVERPEQWLRLGNPWEFPRHEYLVPVQFYGRCVGRTDARGEYRVDWVDTKDVVGMPYDTPVAGFRNGTVNTLRLWQARATREFDLDVFNAGDYLAAVEQKDSSENISKVLYPNDSYPEGKELRLKQQYFFVRCSIVDIVRRYLVAHDTFDAFPDKVVIQLNDTHPTIAIPELLRVLVDEHRLPWDQAWRICTRTFAYTNHTLLAEALETWSVATMERLLPRHMQLIYEINARHLASLAGTPFDTPEGRRRLSIIDEGGGKRVRMAHLATVGSHHVNGVAALHSKLIKETLLPEFDALTPGKIINVTNGVTPRRWLLQANPRLASMITEAIGGAWTTQLDALKQLEPLAGDAAFQKSFREVKRLAKVELAAIVAEETGVALSPDALFDVQVKRIHEYKRQLLNVMHVIALYQKLKADPAAPVPSRAVIFGGKSAPGYALAKLIIRLVGGVAQVVNADPVTRGKLRVVFLPNYRVSLAEKIFPASDLSEQISTAGKEASGTGNMKFALNGALTIGTLDGANVEIREEVGAENFFLFGLTADEVARTRAGGYDPWALYQRDPELRAVLDAISRGDFADGNPSLFQPIVDALLRGGDEYLLLADFRSYCDAQRRVEALWQDQEAWTRKAILNVARMGKFSSDRSVGQYAEEIWGAAPVPISL